MEDAVGQLISQQLLSGGGVGVGNPNVGVFCLKIFKRTPYEVVRFCFVGLA